MYCLIAAEAAIFVIFVVAYLFYVGKSASGPTPAVLHAPIFFSICLLSSSWTIHRAVTALRRGEVSAFARWWIATIALGALFLAGTGLEWRHLIVDEGLTIQTNLFGTTYYSLVGLHAGIVVSKQERVPTWQGAPLAIRAGLEASGLEDDRGEEKKR